MNVLAVLLLLLPMRSKSFDANVSKEQDKVAEDGADRRNVSAASIAAFAKSLSTARSSLRTKLQQIDQLLTDGPAGAFRAAQKQANATDAILDDLDRTAIGECRGVAHALLVASNVVVQSFRLNDTDYVGLAVYDNPDGTTRVEEVRSSTEDARALLARRDLVAAAYLPRPLRDQMRAAAADRVVVVTAFLSDKLFADVGDAPPSTVGVVFGVALPGHRRAFAAPVTVLQRRRERATERKRCAHWLHGGWSPEGVATSCGGADVCEYYHATHFGLLLTGDEDVERAHRTALDVVTLVGCALSAVGIAGVLLTAALFAKWRSNKGNVVLANYAFATLLEIAILYASGRAKAASACGDRAWCRVTGVLLHYVVLAHFFWMLVISYLQYKRYVELFGDVASNLVAKACLVGWAAPLAIVVPVAIVYVDDYANAHTSVCYPDGVALVVGILLPIGLVVVANLAIFGMIAANLFAGPTVRSTRDGGRTLLKFRLLVLLFFQLGISWTFGFLGKLHVSLLYIFCLTAPLQGFFVFLIFIVFNKPTRMMYVNLVRPDAGCARTFSTNQTNRTSSTDDALMHSTPLNTSQPR